MISRKDVIRLKIPFPDISSGLAAKAHMFICRENIRDNVELIKCQSLKPYMLYRHDMQHYWDETADITRNPFSHTTRIDCDKEFTTHTVKYGDMLKTTSRPDVCDDVIYHVEDEMEKDGYQQTRLDESKLLLLNAYVSRMPTATAHKDSRLEK